VLGESVFELPATTQTFFFLFSERSLCGVRVLVLAAARFTHLYVISSSEAGFV
jgi:hypothetical protein